MMFEELTSINPPWLPIPHICGLASSHWNAWGFLQCISEYAQPQPEYHQFAAHGQYCMSQAQFPE